SQNRHRQNAYTNHSNGEQQRSGFSGQRSQRLSRLVSGADVPLARLIEGGSGPENDEVDDQIGKEHSNIDVPLGVVEFLVSSFGTQLRMPDDRLLLNLLAGLPEIHIGGEPGSENRHYHGEVLPVELKFRGDGRP